MKKLFSDKGFWKTSFKLTVPVALQNLLTGSFSLVDTLLVSSLGTIALSSVGMSGQWAWLMNMILVGFCSATTLFVSQYWGIKDDKSIRHYSGISIMLCFGVSLAFTVASLFFPEFVIGMFNKNADVISMGAAYIRIASLSYIPIAMTNILAAVLRAVENVKLPMYVSAATTLLNIFLDYALIFGKCGFPELGIKGAAVATVFSAWLGVGVIVVISVFQHNILVTKSRLFLKFNRNELKQYIKKATPVVINEGMWGFGTFIFNVVFGNMGYEYFSALTIIRSFENVAFVIFIGITSAASVMIGKSIGKGEVKRGIEDSKRFSVIVPVLAVIISVLIVVFRAQLVGVFNLGSNISPLALETAYTLMIFYALAFPLRMFAFLQIVAIFRAGGETVTGAKAELACLWLLSIPATLIAVYVLKVPFVIAYLVMYIFEDVPKVIFCIRFYLSKKWIKPVTKEGKLGLESYYKSRGNMNE